MPYQQEKTFLHNQREETNPITLSSHCFEQSFDKGLHFPQGSLNKTKTPEVYSRGIFLASPDMQMTDNITTAVISNVSLRAN